MIPLSMQPQFGLTGLTATLHLDEVVVLIYPNLLGVHALGVHVWSLLQKQHSLPYTSTHLPATKMPLFL